MAIAAHVLPSPASVSVIMVSYNTGPILWRAIESVLVQAGLCELILVDNGNSAKVVAELQEIARREPKLKLITGHGNVGFAKACNLGAEAATGDYLLLLNPDCIITADTFIKVIEALNTHPDAWMAGCCIVNPDGTEQSGSRRNILTPWMALVEGLHLYRIAPRHPLFKRMNFHNMAPPQDTCYVPAISGAFMMMRTATYRQMGGMDERYFFHVEDLDLCFQVHKQGGKVIYLPHVQIIHYRSTSQVSDGFIELHKAHGVIRYFRKNFRRMYVPGFLTFFTFLVYFRLLSRVLAIKTQSLVAKKILLRKHKLSLQENELISHLLMSYKLFAEKDTHTGPKDVENRGPFLVAGASGQVGLCILRRLLAAEVPVTALYYSRAIDFSHPLLTWKQADLKRGRHQLQDIKAKTLIYTPALWYLPELLKSLPDAGIERVVCFSSTSIFAKANSKSPYEKELVNKFIWAEEQVAHICEERGIALTIMRPTLIYGIGLDRNISRIVRFIKHFGFFPIIGKGEGLRQPVHADDLAIAVLKSLNCQETYGKAYNLCGGEKISYYDMVARLFDILGMKRRIITVRTLPFWLDLYAWMMRKPDINGEIARRMSSHLVFDDAEAKRTFGYAPRPFLQAGMYDLEPDLVKSEHDLPHGAADRTFGS